MSRPHDPRVEQEARAALEFFRRHTTSNPTVNGILRSSRMRFELLSRRMMYQINCEYRKKQVELSMAAARSRPKHILRKMAVK